MKSRGIFWGKTVVGFAVLQWPIAGDGRKHERHQASQVMPVWEGRLMFVPHLQGPCVVCMSCAVASLWNELHILSHCISYGDISHLNRMSSHPLPWLAQQVYFTGELSLRAQSESSNKVLRVAMWITLCRCHTPLCLGSLWSKKFPIR